MTTGNKIFIVLIVICLTIIGWEYTLLKKYKIQQTAIINPAMDKKPSVIIREVIKTKPVENIIVKEIFNDLTKETSDNYKREIERLQNELDNKVVEMVGIILAGLSAIYDCKISLDLTNLKITENSNKSEVQN